MEEKYQLYPWEKVIKITFWHRIFYVRLFFMFFIFGSIISGIYFFWSDIKVLWIVYIVLGQFFIVYLYKLLIDYEFEKVFITNFRIIGFSKKNIFEYQFEEFYYENVFEIKAKKVGYFQNNYDYGNISLIWKNKTEIFVLKKVLQPHQIAKLIHDTMNSYFKEFNKK